MSLRKNYRRRPFIELSTSEKWGLGVEMFYKSKRCFILAVVENLLKICYDLYRVLTTGYLKGELKTMIIVLSGPSGIGKGYIKDSLKEKYPYIEELVWYTTRNLRPNELINSNRKHISEEEFEEMVKKDEMVLAQGMFGHQYAVRKQDLLPREGVFLTEVHPFVIEEAKSINPHIITIGLVTDDYNLLRERLVDRRKTESLDEVERRIQSAKDEVSAIRDKIRFYDSLITIRRDNEDQIATIAQELFARYTEGGDLYVRNKCRESDA